MGIIHHANYIHWFEEARVDFMEQLGYGYDKTVENGVDIAVLEVSCRYRSMVRFGDTVDVAVGIKNLTPAKMVVGYVVTDHETGEVRTTGESTHCFLSREGHAILRLNRAIPELYSLFEDMVEGQRQ
jgi:acyl-CoA thioester hydrolase